MPIFTALTLLALSTPSMAEPPANAQGYWNDSNMRSAKPIELQMDRKTGVAQLITTPASLLTEPGKDWNNGGLPQTAVGKIFFTVGASNYVCSGALVDDNNNSNDETNSNALVLTAGHCVIDKGRFSTNFMFVPNYDYYLDNNLSVPSSAKWYASSLVLRTEFASTKQFNNTAIRHDWAFAVIRTGTFTKDKVTRTNGKVAPDAEGNSFGLAVDGFKVDGYNSTAFGYPAAGVYAPGNKLIYANGVISTDPVPNTWGMNSNLTGGASGGPWLSSLSSDYKLGNISSLNSYKYTGDLSKMYGPKFGPKTTSTYELARGITTSTTNLIDTKQF